MDGQANETSSSLYYQVGAIVHCWKEKLRKRHTRPRYVNLGGVINIGFNVGLNIGFDCGFIIGLILRLI